MRRIAGQGMLLFGGFGLAQACSFLRNALIGTWLAKGDFGIAATIILVLQLMDVVSDLGADRLIVQANDGDEERLLSSAHSVLLARGLFTAAIIYATAGPVTRLFGIDFAQWAFEAAALVPLLKGFLSLDARRQQRRLANRSVVVIEILPQILTLALTIPVLFLRTDYSAVLWLCLLQAVTTVLTSHVVAERRYRLGLDANVLRRIVSFGWPIWISAFPLIAVYQGDRILVGHFMGMEQLAGYSAAFMLTMVPGLLAAKICHALLLPLLASVNDDQAAFKFRTVLMTEGAVLVAAGYTMLFVVAGGDVLVLAFGANYGGLGNLVAWLGVMWALRMVQAPPGIALMAVGDTRPLLAAGVIRACALPVVALFAFGGAGLIEIAIVGAAGEVASLAYICSRAAGRTALVTRSLVWRAAFLVPVGLAGASAAIAVRGFGWTVSRPTGMALAGAAIVAGAALLPGTREIMGRIREDLRVPIAVSR
jgi:O-antigen/teichoic acid export membrane protein